MKQNAFERAEHELVQAKAKSDAMSKARTIFEVRDLWSEFLTCSQRFFSRIAAGSESKDAVWHNVVRSARRKDPLLQYLEQARHADEHGIARIAEGKIGKLEIGGPGSGSGYVKSVMILNDTLVVENDSAVTVAFERPGIILNEVVNRGVSYAVPTEHEGKPIEEATPFRLAALGIAYMESVLAGAKRRLADNVDVRKRPI
jgi:hypothetical protein